MRSLFRASAAAIAFVLLTTVHLCAQSLHQKIDQLIAAGHPNYANEAAPLATDSEFMRRVTLDLTGTIPTAAEVRSFLSDQSADKRTRLIDKLLAGPGYARRMTWHVDVMLMERRRDLRVPRAAWEQYLRAQFEENRPYDEIVKEILSADGADAKLRAPAKFLLDRDLEPNLVTRDIGRLFLGRNMQCAQCHDSPIVDDYKQEHYYGILAFVNRTSLFPAGNANAAASVIAEKAEGEVTFTSVFDKSKVQKATGPKVPGGKTIPEPVLAKGKEYKVAPAPTVRPIPVFSRREHLAAAVVESPMFRRNAANRFWALMLGRGLVHPLDLDHRDNPPSHPELLDLLAEELAAHKFDLKWFLRELALSQTYQRSSEMRASMKEAPPDRCLAAVLKPLAPEQLAYAMMQATGFTNAERLALGAKCTDTALDARLAPQLPAFVRMFGSQAGQPDEFQASLDQTLFLKHNSAIRSLFAQPRKGCLLDRLSNLAQLGRSGEIADELFISVFGRPATDDDKKDIAAILKDVKNPNELLSEVIWAMIASAEFRFNH
jgi:hypothetical protein